MQRRHFLSQSLMHATSVAGIQLFGMNPLRAQGETDKRRLFVVFLRGGFDGLLACPSASNFSAIEDRRRFYRDQTFEDLTQYNVEQRIAFKVHEDMKDLLNVPSGLALFPHAGSLHPTRSHFEQMDIIEGGNSQRILPVGYLARAASAGGRKWETVSVGAPFPKSLRGPQVDPLIVSSRASLSSRVSVTRNVDGKNQVITRSNSSPESKLGMKQRLEFMSRHPATEKDCPEGGRICLTAHEAASVFDKVALPANLDRDPFNLAAAIALSDLNPRIITINVAGWDVHRDALDFMCGPTGHMKNLSDGLVRLRQQLVGSDEWNNSVVVVMSEFGRTIRMNGSGGFDHGRGGLMMVLGGRIRIPTNLTHFPQSWNLNQVEGTGGSEAFRVRVDYRHILGQIFRQHFNLADDAIRGSSGIFPNLDLIRNPRFYV
jgi:uncharacterized protein (DUF1501 family)